MHWRQRKEGGRGFNFQSALVSPAKNNHAFTENKNNRNEWKKKGTERRDLLVAVKRKERGFTILKGIEE